MLRGGTPCVAPCWWQRWLLRCPSPLARGLADNTVMVPGLAFPRSDTYLTYFGCEDLYHADTRAPQVRIGRGASPGRQPAASGC